SATGLPLDAPDHPRLVMAFQVLEQGGKGFPIIAQTLNHPRSPQGIGSIQVSLGILVEGLHHRVDTVIVPGKRLRRVSKSALRVQYRKQRESPAVVDQRIEIRI